jgi:hypothetical protein
MYNFDKKLDTFKKRYRDEFPDNKPKTRLE